MSIIPIITFKAGICDLDPDVQPPKAKPRATPGYIYLYAEDDLIHFCWRPRGQPMSEPELDLVMFPTDCQFRPYERVKPDSTNQPKAPTNGRIYVLKFSSSSQRHLFWLQSKSQSPSRNPSFFSARDLKLGLIVDQLLQGEEVNVPAAIAEVRASGGDDDAGDDDHPMEDVQGTGDGQSHGQGGSSAAGQGGARAEESRVQNFLNSLKGSAASGSGSGQQSREKIFATLPDLLPPSTTVPVIETADASVLDRLLSFLPPTLLLLAQDADDLSSVDPSSETAQAAIQALSLDQKRDILKQVLHSPQFSQSLGSLTVALRDGGLPTVSDALGIKLKDGGFVKGGGMPLGGGEAVEAFIEGVKTTVGEEEKKGDGDGDGERMDTDD
ncbi:MAG: hypothetical protein M1816_005272 [Peltula sp. TS41687]|nr:MAG: hypothetical protein M1816_005272 [Peltula sp. TS41687]